MIAKLNAYGMDETSLRLMYSYLNDRKQKVRINSSYSSWSTLLSGVPQGSIIGPLLFNIYLVDLFLFIEKCNLANYADDCTLYTSQTKTDNVIKAIETDSKILFAWFKENGMKANPDKSHLILSNSNTKLYAFVDDNKIHNQNEVEMLGITINNKLSFNKHMSKLCIKDSKKLHALIRVAYYMTEKQRKKIMHSFIYAQFQYCPLVWIFHSREMNNRVNKIHERALRVVYRDYNNDFQVLLDKNDTFTIHEKCIQSLATELFKVKKKLSPEILDNVFVLNTLNKYHSKRDFNSRNIHSVHFGISSLAYLAPKIWSIVPKDLKNESSVISFKKKIKRWKPVKCPCRICETYIEKVGFVNVT